MGKRWEAVKQGARKGAEKPKGFGILGEALSNVMDGIAGFFGGVADAGGSIARGAGRTVKGVGKGVEYGMQGAGEVGKSAGYLAHGIGYTLERGGRWAKKGMRGYVELPQEEFDELLELEPEAQANELEKVVRKHDLIDEERGTVRVPYSKMREALKIYHQNQKPEEGSHHYKKHSPLEEALQYNALLIAMFGLVIVMFLPLSITGFAVLDNAFSSSGLLTVIGAFILIVSFFLFFRTRK